ncbi:hypothetical protein AVEN_40009-1 [Araneus ventricosus]|uniref:Uncharacterized protein n=1 Tax=Araneus ventricosus TaxID=182803 RepID=A0A4Y2FZB4_ARAVE|nr:hypothetical protein AVEN_40009-1 [Araneus ventricosus]
MAGLSSPISPLRIPLMTTRQTAFYPFSEQQLIEIRPTSMEIAWPVTAGLGVRVLNEKNMPSLNIDGIIPIIIYIMIRQSSRKKTLIRHYGSNQFNIGSCREG